MTLPVFVVDAESLRADSVELSGDEGRHAVVVKRIRVGEHVMLTDTLGSGAECVVRSVSKNSLAAEVLVRREEMLAQPRLVVVQAIPKGDYGERAVDLLTEVGVDEIVPWASSRTIVSWSGERRDKALSRWRATARAAAKQSRRLRFSVVAALHTTEQVVERVQDAALALVLHETADTSLTAYDTPVEGEVVIVVGPEGGLTDAELSAFAAAGARVARLGPTVLRSSTAGAVAAAVISSRTSRWS
ncbi:MAG: rRNA (uracil1498-N3)-methyltransferase [Nocardioidaceae bacterium]|nr:rRNA (uracil1498-N3)-methyltransferase [Nocardioidaceae bacterium]